MAQQRARDHDQLPVFKLDGRRNKMEFIRGFRRVAEHYHITEIVYDNLPRPADGDNLEERRAAWDELNFRFYMSYYSDVSPLHTQ